MSTSPNTLFSLSLTITQLQALEQRLNLVFMNAVADAFAKTLAASPILTLEDAATGLKKMQVAMAGAVIDLAIPWESARAWIARARAWNSGDGVCSSLVTQSMLEVLQGLMSAPLDPVFDAAISLRDEIEGVELALKTATVSDSKAVPNQLGPKTRC